MKKFAITFFICFSVLFGQAQSMIDSSLVAYYPFNGNDSDYSVYGNHPIFNNATFTTDRFGYQAGAYKFNGQNTFIQVPNSSSLNTGNKVSICAWVKVSGFYYGRCHGNMIMQKADNGNVPNPYALVFSDGYYTNGQNCNGSIPDTLQQTFGFTYAGDTTQKIDKERWYFICGTYDGAYAKFYVNGKLVSINFIPAKFFNNPHDLFIGKLNDWQYPYWFNGSIDELRIYNRALNKNEIRQLYTHIKETNVTGNIFVDNNNNGIKDGHEFGSSYTKVMLNNGDYTFADYQGDYDLYADASGCYKVTVDTTNTAYIPTPPADSFCITNVHKTVIKNFRMLLSPTAKDSLQVNIIPYFNAARPGFIYPVIINYLNSGNTTLSPTITFSFDTSILIYDSSSVTGVFRNWNKISLATNQLYPKQRNFFVAFFRLKTTAVLGDSLRLYCTISGGAATATDNIIQRIRGSFDPNSKEATPILTTQEVKGEKSIEYTIRFENVGSDTAFNVTVIDTLSTLLQRNSIQIISSSHPFRLQMVDRIIRFNFEEINLPDSNTDKLGCHGYVKFLIKPLSTLTAGTIINNKAAIYFDYNAPIITNVAQTVIKNVVTPVELVSFSAQHTTPNKVALNWQTALEENADKFIVQRSLDGNTFENIFTLRAKGRAGFYSQTDNLDNLNSKTIFYRLLMLDKDGKAKMSNVVSIKISHANSFVIYPNPSKDDISISRLQTTKQTVQIISSVGIVVMEKIIVGTNSIINISALSKGVYMLKFVGGDSQIIIKQ